MTPEEVKDFFEVIVDDTLDEDATYNLMDAAYTKRNESRVWAMLMKLDSSITHSPGNTWETEKTLPTDFGSVYKMFGGDTDNEYLGVPFVDIIRYKTTPNRYTIDLANLKARLTGAPSSALTMYLFYQYVPTSLFGLSAAQKTSMTTIVWPTRFRRLLAFDMAAMVFGGVDADEITRQMEPKDRAEAMALEKAMIAWDNRNMLKMMQNSSAPLARGDIKYDPNRIDLDFGK